MEKNAALMTDIELASHHAWFHHGDADGYITIAKKSADGFIQNHLRPKDLAVKLTEWLGEDVYFSQNTFYKPNRNVQNIRQLRSLYVDVDCYLFNYIPEFIVMDLEQRLFKVKIPEPNLVIFSGRGLVLIWLLQPAPYKALPLWQVLQNQFCKELKEFGSDPKATDAARVFRIGGSINSKNGAKVEVQFRHDYRYTLRELQHEYLPELDDKAKQQRKTKKAKQPKRSKIRPLFNLYSLHMDRANDLIRLCELREWDVEGNREVILFLYRYWMCCYLTDPVEALEAAKELNGQFVKPLPLNEVEKHTRSAETAYKSNEKQYKYSNEKLVEILNITPEEQMGLKTIIGRGEKRKRNTVATRVKRGSVDRFTYLAQEKTKTNSKLDILKSIIAKHPEASVRELAAITGYSKSYIQKLKTKM